MLISLTGLKKDWQASTPCYDDVYALKATV